MADKKSYKRLESDEVVVAALVAANWNQSAAAEALGVSQGTVASRVRDWKKKGIVVPASPRGARRARPISSQAELDAMIAKHSALPPEPTETEAAAE